jgi:transposase
MDRFIGVDAHLQSCFFSVMSATGKVIQETPVETSGEMLTAFVKGIAGRKHLCMEEGQCSEWLCELFEPLVAELVVIQPGKHSGSKDDASDARRAANCLRTGDLQRMVYKTDRFTTLRAAVRADVKLTRDIVRVKNRLKTLFNSRGISGSGDALYKPDERGVWLSQLPAPHRTHAELLAAELDAIAPVGQQARRWLLEEAARTPLVKLIATAPGLGMLRASQVVATVITPHRFRTKRQFWSYCGLGVTTRVSAQYVKDRTGKLVKTKVPLTRGLNRNRNGLLKGVFKGAAQAVVARQHDSHPLKQHHLRLLENGTRPNLAQLTLARRIAAAVLAMWKTKEAYDPEKHQRT